MKNTKVISAIAGLFILFGTLAGASWGAWDLKQDVSNNTSWRLIQTFEQLTIAKKHRRLSQVEWLKWCKAGKQLHVFTSCPRR